MSAAVSAVLVAAGSSTRMGFDKLSFDLGGVTVLEQSIRAFDAHPMIDELILVAGANEAFVRQAAAGCKKPVRVVTGGATRAASACNGVRAAQGAVVAVHDAARPFVSEQLITDALLPVLRGAPAAAPAVPVKDTVKQSALPGDGKTVPTGCTVQTTPDRSTLFAVQTPQCCSRRVYLNIISMLDEETAAKVTDDCSLFELAGLPVQLTQGNYANIKITTKEDLPRAEKEKQMRIGHGYDVHRLVEGRPLIMGGVNIPYEKGLLGHSDADVLAHAVMDAVLGAAALGDIGKHFPDTAAEWKGADSLKLAQAVAALVQEKGYRVVNIDSTILCQKPKLAPHIPAMRANLAAAFGMDVEDVSVKATTEEKLGFTGEGLGIAAHAVALLEKC